VPIRVKALLEESEPTEEEHQRVLELARTEIARQERNEYDALEEAIPDLIRLERYERRAWSRHALVGSFFMVARARVHRGLVQLDPTKSVAVTLVPFDLFMMLLSALSCAFVGWAVLSYTYRRNSISSNRSRFECDVGEGSSFLRPRR
jgi:hypothetical protein